MAELRVSLGRCRHSQRDGWDGARQVGVTVS